MSGAPYSAALDQFAAVCSVGSPQSPFLVGISTRSERLFEAQFLFARQVRTAETLLSLAHNQHVAGETPGVLDVASIGILTRSLIEAYRVLWHLYIEAVNPEERQFRSLVASLHYETERRAIYTMFGQDPDGPIGVGSIMLPFIKDELKKTHRFRGLSPAQQRDVLRGARLWFGQRSPSRWDRYVNSTALAGLYKWTSNHTHAHPFSMGSEVLDGFINGQQFVRMCLEAAAQHLSFAILDFLGLARRKHRLDARDRDLLETVARKVAPRPPGEEEQQSLLERW